MIEARALLPLGETVSLRPLVNSMTRVPSLKKPASKGVEADCAT